MLRKRCRYTLDELVAAYDRGREKGFREGRKAGEYLAELDAVVEAGPQPIGDLPRGVRRTASGATLSAV